MLLSQGIGIPDTGTKLFNANASISLTFDNSHCEITHADVHANDFVFTGDGLSSIPIPDLGLPELPQLPGVSL